MKVSELQGADLDYWVAKANGISFTRNSNGIPVWKGPDGETLWVAPEHFYSPSTKWEHGGPIIERERIEIRPESNGAWFAVAMDGAEAYGPTPLIAAMRAYVASKFGEELPAHPAAQEEEG